MQEGMDDYNPIESAGITLHHDVWMEIKRRAILDNRSVSNMIETILKRCFVDEQKMQDIGGAVDEAY